MGQSAHENGRIIDTSNVLRQCCYKSRHRCHYSRGIMDKLASRFFFSGAPFLLLGQGWLAFLPIRFLVIARRIDVVLGDDLASFF